MTINQTDDVNDDDLSTNDHSDNDNASSDTVYSDIMLLQTISLLNYDTLNVPWSTIEYDSAFVMAIPDREKRKGHVSGTIKNKITTTKLFLKSFEITAISRSLSLLGTPYW